MNSKIIFITHPFKQSLEYNNVDIDKFIARYRNKDVEGLKEIVSKVSSSDIEHFTILNIYIAKVMSRDKIEHLCNSLPVIASIDFNIKPLQSFIIEERSKISENDICISKNIDIKQEVRYDDRGDVIVVYLNKNLYNGIMIDSKKYLIEIISQLFDSLNSNQTDFRDMLAKALVNLA